MRLVDLSSSHEDGHWFLFGFPSSCNCSRFRIPDPWNADIWLQYLTLVLRGRRSERQLTPLGTFLSHKAKKAHLSFAHP
jgi:hypothetical protein